MIDLFPSLQRDLCFFDLEATGLHVIRDRIIQIAIVRLHADGRSPEERNFLVDPGVPIPEEAVKVHGITSEMVKGKPSFVQLAPEIFEFIGDADLAGYNSNRFDIPFLMEEFARAGLDFDIDGRRLIDVQRIFYRMEPRTLRAAVKFYCNRDFEEAHDALEDVRATMDVLQGQLVRYADADLEDEEGRIMSRPVRADVQALHDFTNDARTLDATQRLRYNDAGDVVFNFGKYNGEVVASVFRREPQYYHWMMEKEFSVQVKNIIRQIYEQRDRSPVR